MTGSRLRRLVYLFVVSAGLLVWPAVASAQDDAFKRGLEARGRRDWTQAANSMQEAIKADGRESSTKKVRIGGRFGLGGEEFPYLPHFFLGEALKNRDDCGGAVTEWEISEDQQQVKQVASHWASLQAGYKECAARGVLLRSDYAQQVATADQAYNDTLSLLQRLEKQKDSNSDWQQIQSDVDRARTDLGVAYSRLTRARQTRLPADFVESRNAAAGVGKMLRSVEARLNSFRDARSVIAQRFDNIQQRLATAEKTDHEIDTYKVTPAPPLTASRESGRDFIKRARERIGVAERTQNVGAADEALQFAQNAETVLGQVLEQIKQMAREEFQQRLQELDAAAAQGLSFFASAFVTLERRAAQNPDKVPVNMVSEREALLKEQSTLQRRFENARRTENAAALEDVTRRVAEARTRLDALIALFGPATLRDRGVEPALEQGVRHYASNQYQQALAALDPDTLKDAPLQGHVHMFRAASFYALYALSGEKEQKLLNDALAEVQRCKEVDPALQPNPRAFSPRFINFFQTAGAPGTQAAAPVGRP